MTKEEKIKEAWGDKYPINGVDEFGFSNDFFKIISTVEYDFITVLNGFKIRPKSLQGIEENNGWIRIESEEQIKDFQNEFCWVIIKTGELEKMYIHSSNKNFILNMCTHYQPIVKPKPPIY